MWSLSRNNNHMAFHCSKYCETISSLKIFPSVFRFQKPLDSFILRPIKMPFHCEFEAFQLKVYNLMEAPLKTLLISAHSLRAIYLG